MKNLIFVFAVLVSSLFVFNTHVLSQSHEEFNFKISFDIENGNDTTIFHEDFLTDSMLMYYGWEQRRRTITKYVIVGLNTNQELQLENIEFETLNLSPTESVLDILVFNNPIDMVGSVFNNETIKVDDTLYIGIKISNSNIAFDYNYFIPIVFVYEGVLSVEEFENVNSVSDLRVYPNPLNVGQQLTVEFETELTDMPIEVYNMNGQRVYLNDDFRFFGNNKVSINTYDFVPGMYLVKIGTETKKIIVQ